MTREDKSFYWVINEADRLVKILYKEIKHYNGVYFRIQNEIDKKIAKGITDILRADGNDFNWDITDDNILIIVCQYELIKWNKTLSGKKELVR